MATYTPIVTLAGQAKIANSIAGGAAIVISQYAVGDANGGTLTPLETMTALLHEVDRVAIDNVVRDAVDPTKVVVTATLPAAHGPYTVREHALYTSDGQLFAIGAYPETTKSTAAQGATQDVVTDFIVQVSETANVTILLDPSNLIQISQFGRVPFIAVDQHLVASPPVAPALEMLVTIAVGATGAFAGLDLKFAQWDGYVWRVANAFEGTLIRSQADGKFYRKTAASWISADPDTSNQGLATLATAANMTAGAEATKVVTPQLAAAQAQSGSWLYAADSGVADAYVVNLVPAPAALTDGMEINFRTANKNTTIPTLKVNAFPQKTIRLWNGDDLAGGEVYGDVKVRYNAATDKFRLVSASSARPTWRRWYDFTVGAGGIASIDLTLPTWAEHHRITSRIGGVTGSQQSVWARVSLDGATFLAASTDYYAHGLGTYTNGMQGQTGFPIGCTVDSFTTLNGWNVANFYIGGAAAVVFMLADYAGYNAAAAADHLDFGKTAGYLQSVGKALKMRLLGGGYLATGPNGGNIPPNTRIIIEGLTNQ